MKKTKTVEKKTETKVKAPAAPKAPAKKEVKTCCQVFKAGDEVKLEGFGFTVMEVTGNKVVLKDKSL